MKYSFSFIICWNYSFPRRNDHFLHAVWVMPIMCFWIPEKMIFLCMLCKCYTMVFFIVLNKLIYFGISIRNRNPNRLLCRYLREPCESKILLESGMNFVPSKGINNSTIAMRAYTISSSYIAVFVMQKTSQVAISALG